MAPVMSNSYVVMCKSGTSEEAVDALMDHVEAMGGIITQHYTTLKGFAAIMSDSVASYFESMSFGDGPVDVVEPDTTLSINYGP